MNASMCHNLKNNVTSRDIRVVIIRRIVYTYWKFDSFSTF